MIERYKKNPLNLLLFNIGHGVPSDEGHISILFTYFQAAPSRKHVKSTCIIGLLEKNDDYHPIPNNFRILIISNIDLSIDQILLFM